MLPSVFRSRSPRLLAALFLAGCAQGSSTQSSAPNDFTPREDNEPATVQSGSAAVETESSAVTNLPLHRDRDPEQEREKMERSQKQSREARRLLKSKQLSAAIEEARKALRTHELNVDAMLVISEAFFHQGKQDLALSVASSALRVDPRVLNPQQRSKANELQGIAHFAKGNEEAALQAFRRAADGDPKNASAWNNVGIAYMRQGDLSTAEQCFRYASEVDGEFIEARSNHAAALRGLGRLSDAIAILTDLAKGDDCPAMVFFNLGVLYLDAPVMPGLDTQGRMNAAISHFERYRQRVRGQGSKMDRLGNELVSPEQAELYIAAARKVIAREERRAKRRGPAGGNPDKFPGRVEKHQFRRQIPACDRWPRLAATDV